LRFTARAPQEWVGTLLRTPFAKFQLDELPQNQKRVKLAERALQLGTVSRRGLA
jgi:hypothetical protein